MLKASCQYHPLEFRQPAGTSRGVLHRKDAWFIRLEHPDGTTGIGEVSFIPGLSVEDGAALPSQLASVCRDISSGQTALDEGRSTGQDQGLSGPPDLRFSGLPGLQFALETALLDLQGGGQQLLFDSPFVKGEAGIRTNGLIWMGDPGFMLSQVRTKLDAGFGVLKLKVGALDMEDELDVLREIRKVFAPADLEIRLDANGAWSPEEAPERMRRFAAYHIHSVEQPLMAGRPEAMARLCREEIIPVALDEELIGIEDPQQMSTLLTEIRPAYIILKPGLLGGFRRAMQWIGIAENNGAGWWVTSALESAVGLNAIAQWTAGLGAGIGGSAFALPQGLGTGQIYSNNFASPLRMEGERLWHRPAHAWDLKALEDD